MKDPKSFLVVLHDLDDLKLVENKIDLESYNTIFAVDDGFLYEKLENDIMADEVVFLEKMESFREVQEKVLSILKKVNSWLEELAPADDLKKLLKWKYHAEGGKTTQKIQDVLILVDSYFQLLEQNTPDKVIMPRRRYRWEDEVFLGVVKEQGVPVSEIKPWYFSLMKSFSIVEFDRTRFNLISRGIKVWGRVTKLFLRIFKIKLQEGFSKKTNQQGDGVIFQIRGDAKKHAENIMLVMKALKNRDNKLNPIALTWNSKKNSKLIKDQINLVFQLESYFSLRYWFGILYQALNIWRVAKKNRSNLKNMDELNYRGIQLEPYLWPFIHGFILSIFSERLVMKKAIQSFLEYNTPSAVKVWGGGIYDFGKVCVDELPAETLKVSWTLGSGHPTASPLEKARKPPIDLYFAAGKQEKGVFKSRGIPDENIIVTGKPRYTDIDGREFDTLKMREELGLSMGENLYLFYAPQVTNRGLIGEEEHFKVARTLVKYSTDKRGIVLMIKPHPADNSGIWDPLIGEDEESVYLYDRSRLPYKYIKASDWIITKYSTVGHEALLLGKCLISIALDGDKTWNEVYGNVSENFYKLEDLLDFLDKLRSDNNCRKKFESLQSEVRKDFINNNFSKTGKPAAERIANELERRLTEK